ncbi:hypothetical protein MGG_17285 [Pyricularia oryzae 70-15]|uniref:Uncharacterized protein n=1 Tax=Pyricularia oryzae (strain 70-15 / ATCC MYA-4617 / FGSC 8958) TaxID=242507 RepID=G4NAW4_PYRO7|nr:uncharacterized protein MGG_17285 [Pyricularia oryzae 70-15]EHA51348.1 hypothetical protein MGG_17285 [Pyricularia oryzae 70-15]
MTKRQPSGCPSDLGYYITGLLPSTVIFIIYCQFYLVPKWSGEWWNSVTLLMQECNLKVSEWVFRKFIRGTGTFSGVRTPISMSEMHFYLLFSAFSTGYLPRRT